MIWITQKDGRLGNRLILFSHLISFSGTTGIPVYYPAFEEYGNYFCGPRRSPFSRYPVKNFPGESGTRWKRAAYVAWRLASLVRQRFPSALRPGNARRAMTFDQRIYLDSPEFIDLAQRCRFLFLEGNYFRCRNRQWLDAQDTAIKDFFRPVEPYSENSRRQARQARADADILVGVHIRRGDYRTFYQGRYFYTVPQYRTVMEKTAALFPGKKLGFLVCSDEAHDAREFSPFYVTSGSRHFIEDLYALAQCDYLAGAPSTFSKWASYYGGVPLYDIMDPGAAMALNDFKVFELI
jgi:hypothetical protein